MDVMTKNLALIALLATTLALPASGALARGGGGGFGGGGHIGGFGGAHMGGGFGGHIGGFHGGRFAHRNVFTNDFGYGGYDDSCWDWQVTPGGWVCVAPY
jgi:hypothetical protein